MRRRSAWCASLLLAGILPVRAGALAQLDTLAAACYGSLSGTPQCLYDRPLSPYVIQPTASIQDIIMGTGVQMGRAASATITGYDRFTATAEAGMDYTLSPAAAYPSLSEEVSGIAYVRLRDTLTATGATGTGLIRMSWEVEGANSFVNAGFNPLVISDVFAEARLVAICNSGTGLSHDCTSDTLVWEDSGPAEGTLTFDIPIVFGVSTPYLIALELHARSGFRSFGCETPCIVDFHADVDADFGSTGRLVSVQLFDASSNELSPSGIESESGFDYSLAPEPGAMLQAAVGALVLLAARRLRAARA